MAIINKLILDFNYQLIDSKYDFYILSTSDNYIKKGAYVLDRPINQLKAKSIAYETGRNIFVMFDKNSVSKEEFSNSIEDEIIKVDKINAKDIKEYILFRLLMYSLNNYESEEMTFNNLAGKLYLYSPYWMYDKRDYFYALKIDVDQGLNIKAEATSFFKLSLFSEKIQKDYTIPKYSFSINGSLKRELHVNDNNELYINKNLYHGKAEIEFLDTSDEKKKGTKVYFIYKTLDLIRSKYNDLVTINLDTINLIETIGKSKDKFFIEKAKNELKNKKFNFVNLLKQSEYDSNFKDLVEKFKQDFSYVEESNKVEENAINVILLHNEDYYINHKYVDPYKSIIRNDVIQCLTIEDSVNKIIKDKRAIYESIIKEIEIKNELINYKKILIDNWEDFGYTSDYIFGKEKDGILYFIKIKPTGEFSLYKKADDFTGFKDDDIQNCANVLVNYKGKEKTIISDNNGNIIILSRTSMFCLPTDVVFNTTKFSRGKESRKDNLEGIVDINLFDYKESRYFNAGIIGEGMNCGIPKASLLYKIEVVNGKNIYKELLKTMSVTFVKYKNFTVLPYPIKYLNEYIELNINKEVKHD